MNGERATVVSEHDNVTVELSVLGKFFCLLLLAASKNLSRQAVGPLPAIIPSQVSTHSHLGAESNGFMYRNTETTRISSNAYAALNQLLRCESVYFSPQSVYMNCVVGDSKSHVEVPKL